MKCLRKLFQVQEDIDYLKYEIWSTLGTTVAQKTENLRTGIPNQNVNKFTKFSSASILQLTEEQQHKMKINKETHLQC